MTARVGYLGAWVRLAVEISEENTALRALVFDLATALAREREFTGYAVEAIEERFDGKAAA